MAFLFTVQEKSVFPNTETLLISPFKEIWARDKTQGKELAIEELTYIEFVTSLKKSNPYRQYPEKLKAQKVQEEIIRREDWKPDDLIKKGIDEGAKLVAGGPDRPSHLNKGYFVKPTVFADVNNEMTIAKEEIFGPVVSIIPFSNEEEAIKISNDTAYGLTNYIQTTDSKRAQRVARQLRSGMVEINGVSFADGSPFGGYKQSGNGREGGKWGIEEFLEVKSISGWK